jgi:hypothetical protein
VSTLGLNRIVGEAVISDQFRTGLLNGRRAELVRDPRFQLEPDETAALLSIEADSLQDFAAAVEGFIDQRQKVPGSTTERKVLGQYRWPSLAAGAFIRPS